jgi:hypothetical protein
MGVSRNVRVYLPVFRVSPLLTILNFQRDVSKWRSRPFFPLSVMKMVASGVYSMIAAMLLAWSGSMWFITTFFIL